MKLIYYGHFDRPSDCENWIAEALVRAGVLVYRWQRRIGTTGTDWEELIHFVRSEKINVCLISKAPELTPQKIMQLRQTGCKVVWWTFDWMAHQNVRDWYFPLARVSDLCFQTDGTDADLTYAAAGIKRVELHQGADPTLHSPYEDPISESEKELFSSDIAFFGSLYTPRRKALHTFLKNVYGKRYKLWGGSEGFEQGLWNYDYRKAVKLSKIIIGDNFTNAVPGYWSDRVYLTLATGGFFLTSYVPGLEDVFDTGKHLITWNDFSDLQVSIDRYLKDEKMRLEIAEAGHKFVRNNHMYDHRIETFLEKIRELFI